MSAELDGRERAGLERELQSPDDEVRRLATERLAALPEGEALPALVARLGDASWRVRKTAIDRLAGAPAGWAVAEALVAALADADDAGRRNAAAEALVRCGRRAVPTLLEASRTPDADVRKLVVDTLGAIGAPIASERLHALLRDPDPNVRAAAADALGAVDGPGASRALRDVVQRADENVLVRLAALRALARLDAPVTVSDVRAALEEPLLRPAAFAALGRADDPEAVACLLKGLESRARTAREAAIEGLLRLVAHCGPDEAHELARRIREVAWAMPEITADAARRVCEAELGTRLVLVQFLGLVGGRGVVRPLLRAARDEALAEVVFSTLAELGDEAEDGIVEAWPALDAELRRLACALLARTGGGSGHDLLVRAVRDGDSELRAAAADALGARGDAVAVEALCECLEAATARDELASAEEHEALARALVALGSGSEGAERAADHIVARLGGRLAGAPEPVREAAARVLAAVARPCHALIVKRLLGDPSPAVRAPAVRALARVGTAHMEPHLALALADEAPEVRVSAAAAVAERGVPRSVEQLEALLADGEISVRAAAVRALGTCLSRGRAATPGSDAQRSAERAAGLLVAALDDATPVALTALEGLEAAPELAPALARLIRRGEVELVHAAVGQSARLPDPQALEILVPLVAHEHWAVRAAAVDALAARRLRRGAPAMLRRLEVEQDVFVREALLRALARLEA